MKSVYRITCPLCGGLRWKKSIDRNNAIDRILIQSHTGHRKILYAPCLDLGVLGSFHRYIVSRLEVLYLRLTGINIQQLILNSQPLTTQIIPSTVSTVIHSPVDTVIHSPIDIAVCSKTTAKIIPKMIMPKMVVIE